MLLVNNIDHSEYSVSLLMLLYFGLAAMGGPALNSIFETMSPQAHHRYGYQPAAESGKLAECAAASFAKRNANENGRWEIRLTASEHNHSERNLHE
jgi:hypothetical protein